MSAEAERWREVTAMAPDYLPEVQAGDALAAALEATVADRDHWVKVATGTAAMLEAREARIAKLEDFAAWAHQRGKTFKDGPLRHAATSALQGFGEGWRSPGLRRIARDLLAGRAEGEG